MSSGGGGGTSDPFEKTMDQVLAQTRQIRADADAVLKVLRQPTLNSIAQLQELSQSMSKAYDAIELMMKRVANPLSADDRMPKFIEALEQFDESLKFGDMNATMTATDQIMTSYNFLHPFFARNPKSRGVPSAFARRPMQFTNLSIPANSSPHAQFEKAMELATHEIQKKKMGINVAFFERTQLSSVFELKVRVGQLARDNRMMWMMKLVCVENNACIDMVQVIAPHESWHFLEGHDARKLDLTRESRYELWRRASVNLNLFVGQIGATHDLRMPANLLSVLCAFFRYASCLEATCRGCKRVLLDFMPPLVSPNLIASKSIVFYHESCR